MMEEELREQCLRGVRRVLAQRGWELVEDEVTFVEEVLAEVKTRWQNARRPLEKIIEDATLHCYCHLWHTACGADGTIRQRRAFTELHRYLYPIALYRAKYDQYIAEESTQEALFSVWERLDRVRDPGSFARWAGVIVSNAVRDHIRERARKVGKDESGKYVWEFKEITEADLPAYRGMDDAGAALWGMDNRPGSSTGQGPSMTEEIRDRIEAAIRRCLRSKQRQAVIVGLFLENKSFKEVADTLGTTPQNVSVLKSRALTRLRECEEFLSALEDLM